MEDKKERVRRAGASQPQRATLLVPNRNEKQGIQKK